MNGKMKKYKRLLFLLLLGAMMLTGFGMVKAEAAVSRNKAIQMYNRAITNWGRKNSKTTIVHAVHDGAGAWTDCDMVGKKVSLKSLYAGQPRYIFRDLNGDKTVEALFQSGKYVYVFTIYKSKVKCLGVICVDNYNDLSTKIFYNAKAKTFSIRQEVSVRMTIVKSYQIRNGRLKYRNTLARYMGPTDSNYKPQNEYYVNGRRCSNTYFNRVYKAYLGNVKRCYWAP